MYIYRLRMLKHLHELRKHANPEIKSMLRHLQEAGYIVGEGLALPSRASRGFGREY